MDISVGHIHFPEHVRQRLEERRVRYSAIRDRVRAAARMVDGRRRLRAARQTAVLSRQEADVSGEDPDDVLAEVVKYLCRELGEWMHLQRDGGPSLAETREMMDGALARARAVVIRQSRTGVATWRVKLQSF